MFKYQYESKLLNKDRVAFILISLIHNTELNFVNFFYGLFGRGAGTGRGFGTWAGFGVGT